MKKDILKIIIEELEDEKGFHDDIKLSGSAVTALGLIEKAKIILEGMRKSIEKELKWN